MSVTDSLAGEIIPVDGLLLRTVMCDVCSNSEGLTPLLIAASYGHCETVQLLLDAGGDVCQTDDDDNDVICDVMCGVCSNSEGLTPLLIAASYGHCETVRLLLEAGGDVCQTDDDDNDALSYAQQSGCQQCYSLVSHYSGLCPSLLYLSV